MAARYGTIVAGTFRYEITPEDILWMARAATCEGVSSAAASLWTWASRLVFTRSNDLTRLIRAHSQPVNPVWFRDGEACRPGGVWPPTTDPDVLEQRLRSRGATNYHDVCYTGATGSSVCPCSESKLERREKCSERPWSEIPVKVQNTTIAFVSGLLPNPVPRAIDFADRTITPGPSLKLVAEVGGNLYYSNETSRSWPPRHVRIIGPTGDVASDKSSNQIFGLLGFAALSAAGYSIYKWLR
jgi:hypothetical protein